QPVTAGGRFFVPNGLAESPPNPPILLFGPDVVENNLVLGASIEHCGEGVQADPTAAYRVESIDTSLRADGNYDVTLVMTKQEGPAKTAALEDSATTIGSIAALEM